MAGVSVVYDPSRGGVNAVTQGTSAGYSAARAHLVQVGGSNSDIVYHFPYSPVEVSYQNLSAEYEEIQRPMDYAYVARRAPQLTRVSFEFRVADRPSHGADPILRDLEVLRRMASADVPVALIGVGDWMFNSDNWDRAQITGVRGQALFRIMEMGVTVVKREVRSNNPTQADCSVTLIEDRNPVFNVVQLQRLDYEPAPEPQTTNTGSSGNKKSGGGSSKKNTPKPNSKNTPKNNYTKVSDQNKKIERDGVSGGSNKKFT